MSEPVYVLCKRSARDALFACGATPGGASFLTDGGRARRFPSAASALAYRAGLTCQDVVECGVFQLMPDGRLVPPEAAEPVSLWGRNGGGARYPSADAPSGAGRRSGA
jgi:hypothetical protein